MSTVYDGALLFMLPYGEFRAFDDNETLHRSLIADPCKDRYSVKQELVESNLGAISFNIERPSGELDEMGLIGVRLLPDGSGAFFVAIADAQGQPVREILVASRHGLSGPAAVATSFRSDDGRYLYNVQGDPTPEFPSGRIVQYDLGVTPPLPLAILRPEPL